ncbi:mannose-1-phosphate guanylyltransferase/mannose-6-phosphate isomerase [Roseomonas xinghualingensis]|uniref:mannose-1-phosphate guanylyltransferase/mannose-6-phosphate isomerase n=1 Tax=Roseomonas xinghualingensis TaxID=2986475 RepID=UPI0021F0E2C3|nr:mannose-1-phosphate guanylyltransferase/mannose-6-phosphate isomerase [Roseomonas sp. SXEYE001]MCV4207939.1 mannose-1-phosphate guanylyltransferase/mannose-6-phosphate isomerase [Roseomonas sp. SXEYE001]
MPQDRVVPVVLSGGVGTRLWPLSREGFPKQFWPLTGPDTMLQETVTRATGPGFAPPMVICAEAHRFLVAEQLRESGIADARIVLEPAARNSAPAIAAAAMLAAESDPHAVLWIMAADAAIGDLPALHAALGRAAAAARAGHIVAFGMKPTFPETGFGYMETGNSLAELDGAYAIASFVEKPDLARAQSFLEGGRHLWNAGMFVARAATLLAELERLQPELVASVRASVEGASRDLDFVRLGKTFADSPSISIDYAVMEKTAHAAVVPADLGWSDVGSWDALWQVSPKDERGNATHGPVELLDAENCYVRSEGILTSVVGLKDVVVVATEDAVLALHRDRAQDVKKLVDQLKAAKHPQAAVHRRMYRPWGHYEGLIQGDRFQVKKILVRPGEKLSLQKHYHRAEHWVVVNGTAIVERDAERILLRENESVYLPLGCVHRLENPGMIPLTLIEVQSGAYLGEDDIVRFEDTYGRA